MSSAKGMDVSNFSITLILLNKFSITKLIDARIIYMGYSLKYIEIK